MDRQLQVLRYSPAIAWPEGHMDQPLRSKECHLGWQQSKKKKEKKKKKDSLRKNKKHKKGGHREDHQFAVLHPEVPPLE